MPNKDFLLPDLGEGLTEGEIVQWLVQVGEMVGVDQPVAEIETAKAVVEVPSPWGGTVVQLHGEVGEEVQVGTPLITIDVETTDRRPAQPASAAAPEDGASSPRGVQGGSSEEAEVSDLVVQPTDEVDGDSGNVLVGYGTGGGGRTRRRRGQAPAPGGRPGGAPRGAPGEGRPPAGPRVPHREGRPLAKPPVRKMAKDLGVDLTQVEGSGPDGVITREDVEAFAGNGRGAQAPAAPQAPAAVPEAPSLVASQPPTQPAAREQVAQPHRHEPGERIPLRGVRKAIAEKMTISRREIPEATTWVDCDATGLWELRQTLNVDQQDVKVTPLAIVMRACVAGLRKFPDVNASLDTDAGEIVLHRHVNLGFAAQTDRGLIVPVIKDADRKSMLEIAAELNALAAAAREGKVSPDQLTGGTFTLSNYGSFGVDGGSAVINHPEAAILGVGRITDRPWVVDGEIQVRKVMQLSIAFDHRICDGGEAAGFLRFVADMVESPTKLLASL